MFKHSIAAIMTLYLLGCSAAFSQNSSDKSLSAANELDISMVIRIDDVGFCHAANMAAKKIFEQGAITAASVMVTTPWLDEAVEVCREHPEISIGVHTALNSEWLPYRWGPVTPYTKVPSLVDAWGKFFPTRAQFMAHKPDVDEVERELRAQVELAFKKGLNPSYIDHHMGAAVNTPKMRERFENIALDYHLGISRYFGEKPLTGIYSTPPDEKVNELIKQIKELNESGLYILVVHPGLDTSEMAVLRDQNVSGLKNMSEHRQAETDMLCNPEVKSIIKSRGIRLVGYKELVNELGLHSMVAPAGYDPYAPKKENESKK